MRRKFFVLTLALLLSLCFAACAPEGETGEEEQDTRTYWGTLLGTVTEDGSPVSGVIVTAGSERTETDENGAYFIAVYDNGNTVSFEKEGYFTQKKTFKTSSFYKEEAKYSFSMFRIARVTGVVREGGVPVAGAKVVIGVQETETDEEGKFVFEKVIATTMILFAEKDGKRARKALYTEELRTGSVNAELDLEVSS